MGRLIKFAAVAAVALLSSVNVCAVTLHVPSEYATIQAGIDAAVDGDTVLVAPGTYYENIDFVGRNILLASNFLISGDTVDVIQTIMDGSMPTQPDSGSVVMFRSGEDSTAVLNGFTVTHGTGTISHSSAGVRWGGGIACYGSSSPIIMNNRIVDNDLGYVTSLGGGIGVAGLSSFEPSIHPVIRNNVIAGNRCRNGGAGVYVEKCVLAVIESNVFYENSDTLTLDWTGVVGVHKANASIKSNIFKDNDVHCITETPESAEIEEIEIRNNVFYRDPSLSPSTYAISRTSLSTIDDDLSYNCFYGSFVDFFSNQPKPGVLDTVYANANGDVCDQFYNIFRNPEFCSSVPSMAGVFDISPCLGTGDSGGDIGGVEEQCIKYAGPNWYVSPTGSDSLGDGSPENPFATIQWAVDQTATSDTITLLPGVFSGEGNRDIWLWTSNLHVTSSAGRDSTIIDLSGSEYFGFRTGGDGDTLLTMSDLTIRNGEIAVYLQDGFTLLDNVRICNATESGIFARDYEAVIRDCVIDSCSTGLLVYLGNGGSSPYTLSVTNTIFSNCSVGVSGRYGGDPITFDECEFVNNNVGFGTYEMSVEDYIFVRDCDFHMNNIAIGAAATFEHCDISLNRIGFSVGSSSSPFYVTFDGCSLSNNSDTIGILWGTYTYGKTEATLIGCTISDNGGGIYCISPLETPNNVLTIDSSLYSGNAGPITLGEFMSASAFKPGRISNSTIVNNVGGVVCQVAPIAHIIDSCIIANNSAFGISGNEGSAVISCSNVYGNDGGNYLTMPDQTGINGNISEDPLFCDTAAGDYTIMDISPCAPANNTCGALMGAFDIGCSGIPTMLAFDLEADDSSHVINHVPVFSWQYYTPVGAGQDSVEVAVGVDTSWTHAELWNPAPFATGDTSMIYGGLALVDGQDCYVRIRVHNGYIWSEWLNAGFHMNSIPSIPSLLSPDSLVQTGSSPDLWLANASDAENDLLRYDFQVALDSDFISLVAVGSDILQTEDSTSWLVSSALVENTTHYWRARTFDGYEYSDWSAYASFVVNAFPEAPTAPVCTYPPVTEDEVLFEMMPVFTWAASVDDDPDDTVRYRLTLAVDESFTFATTVDSIATPSYQFPDSLDFEEQYWWKMEAYDKSGLTVQSSNELSFWTWTLGDVTHSHAVDISDLTYLVNYLFLNGDDIVPAFVGDFNGSCGIDISDLTLLVNYLFLEGPPPRVGCMPSRPGPATETATVSSKEN